MRSSSERLHYEVELASHPHLKKVPLSTLLLIDIACSYCNLIFIQWQITDNWKFLELPEVGRGQFGKVLLAEWGGTVVAVKCLCELLHQS